MSNYLSVCASARLKRLLTWLPLLVLAGTSAVFFSPLGVLIAICLSATIGAILNRYGLAGGNELGGPSLRSASSWAVLRAPPSGDVELERREFGMGGPGYFTHMLRDGAIVTDVWAGWHDTHVPGVRVGLICRSGMTQWLSLYDENLKQLGLSDDPDLVNSYSRISAGTERESNQLLRRALAAASWHRFHAFRGLWLSQDHGAIANPPAECLQRTMRSGRRLSARLLLPDNLRSMRDPHLLAASPPYELYMDGVPTGRHVFDLADAWESDSGQCLVVGGTCLNEHFRPTARLWHVFRENYSTALCAHFSGEKPDGKRGVFPHYDSRVRSVSNDGKIVLEAFRTRITEGDCVVEQRLDSSTIALPVEWRVPPLRLRVRHGRFSVHAPTK